MNAYAYGNARLIANRPTTDLFLLSVGGWGAMYPHHTRNAERVPPFTFKGRAKWRGVALRGAPTIPNYHIPARTRTRTDGAE